MYWVGKARMLLKDNPGVCKYCPAPLRRWGLMGWALLEVGSSSPAYCGDEGSAWRSLWERRDSEAQSDEGLGMSQPPAVALCVGAVESGLLRQPPCLSALAECKGRDFSVPSDR